MKHATMNAVAWVAAGMPMSMEDGFVHPEDAMPDNINQHYAACSRAPVAVHDCVPLGRAREETPSCPQCAVLLDEAWESQRSK